MTGPTDGLLRGVVTFWKAEKGWGAIRSDALPSGRDVFAHFSVVDADGYRELVAGQAVEFRCHAGRQDSFHFVADWVRALAAGAGERSAPPPA